MNVSKCQNIQRYTFIFYILTLNIITQDTMKCVQGKYIEGDVETDENWMFLTRFCFYSQRGQFKYEIEYPLSYSVQKILLYYDSPSQWPAVYKKHKTCEQKESVLSVENRQIVTLSVNSEFSGCQIVSRVFQSESVLSCFGERRFDTARERWWFIAVSNCNSTKGMKFSYRITMTNGDLGDYRFAHFSADEFKILEMSIAFLILHIILFVMSIFSAVILKQRHLLHTTFKIFLVSLGTYCFSLLLNSIAYLKYASDGIGLPRVKLWGQILQSVSLTEFLLLLLLLAKGYTVTRSRLRNISALKLTGFMVLYSITNIILFIYKEKMFDPGDVLYLYESPAGYGLILLRLISWSMFIYAIVFTLKHYPEKGTFYYPFVAFFTLWFIAGPILILAANFVIDKWVREKVVFGTEVCVTYLAYAIFWCITMPSMTNVNFPYHVRTTQIGAYSSHQMDNGQPSSSYNLDSFVHHPYEPSAPPITPPSSNTYDLFLIGSQSHQLGPISTESRDPIIRPPPIMATGRTVHPQLWPVDHVNRESNNAQNDALASSTTIRSENNNHYDHHRPPPYNQIHPDTLLNNNNNNNNNQTPLMQSNHYSGVYM